MKSLLKKMLYPVRKRAWQFVDVDPANLDFMIEHGVSNSPQTTIIHKAATIIAAEKVSGDYLEFGVFAGNSFIQAYHTIKTAFKQQQLVGGGRSEQDAKEIADVWGNMRYFAFDSFEGLPELEGADKMTRDFAAGKYSYAEGAFRHNLQSAGVPLDKVVITPGWFEQTCTPDTIRKNQMAKASIIHVDCDLYSSTRTVLDFVAPIMADGAIIIFDDWYCYRGNPGLGEQRAFNEWKQSLPDWIFTEYQKEGPCRNSFIASRTPVL
jgi:hypothetical protein